MTALQEPVADRRDQLDDVDRLDQVDLRDGAFDPTRDGVARDPLAVDPRTLADTDDRLVTAAAQVFAERGYDGTSMSELTAATGLAAGGLYHYIEGKDDLLIAICDELLEPLLERAREIVATALPPVEQLRELVEAWVAHVVAHRHHMLVFTQERQAIESQPRWRHVRAQRKAFEKILDDVLARGEADGSMTFADRRLSLLALLGMVNYTPQWVRPNGRLSPAEIAAGYCAIVLGN